MNIQFSIFIVFFLLLPALTKAQTNPNRMDTRVQVLACVEEGTGLPVDLYDRHFEWSEQIHQSLVVEKDGKSFDEISVTEKSLKKLNQKKLELKIGSIPFLLGGREEKFEYWPKESRGKFRIRSEAGFSYNSPSGDVTLSFENCSETDGSFMDHIGK